MVQQATTLEEVRQFVHSAPHVRVVGGGSKANLSREPTLCVQGLSGLIEYQPDEFTFTAWAGTPIAEIEAILAEHGQSLPFDPPFVERGATLGGTLAAGLSGPGRFRYGGVRDFVISSRMVTGGGEIVRGGAKVVKNAAGFDIPKLVVGSLGCFGVLVDLSFKVFPGAAASATLRVEMESLESGIETMACLRQQPLELSALDLQGEGILWIRAGGQANSLPSRIGRIRNLLGAAQAIEQFDEDQEIWRAVREFAWVPEGSRLLKVPINPNDIRATEVALRAAGVESPRRYSVGGNVLWLTWPAEQGWEKLSEMKINGLVLTGPAPVRWLGDWEQNVFYRRLRRIFDPQGKF